MGGIAATGVSPAEEVAGAQGTAGKGWTVEDPAADDDEDGAASGAILGAAGVVADMPPTGTEQEWAPAVA